MCELRNMGSCSFSFSCALGSLGPLFLGQGCRPQRPGNVFDWPLLSLCKEWAPKTERNRDLCRRAEKFFQMPDAHRHLVPLQDLGLNPNHGSSSGSQPAAFCPAPHLHPLRAIPGDLAGHNWEKMLLASHGGRPVMLLTLLQCPGPPEART